MIPSEMLRALVSRAVGGHIRREDVREVARAAQIRAQDVYNDVLIHVAREFLQDRLGFWDADAAANAVWALIVLDICDHGEGYELPQPAYDIYEAFDDGEFDHGDGHDPVERHTKPRLRRLLDVAE